MEIRETQMFSNKTVQKYLVVTKSVFDNTCISPQRVLPVLLTSSSVAMDAVLVRGRCVMRSMTVEMGLMNTHTMTAVSDISFCTAVCSLSIWSAFFAQSMQRI